MPLRMYDCTRSYCFCVTIGPTAVFGSAGSPTGKTGMVSTIACLTSSSRFFGTRSRVPAAHAWPLFRNPKVGVVEQDIGRLAAQLERDALHCPGAVAHDRLANPDRARERDLSHVRVAYELGPDDIA